ncbi:MAG TPA: hypothetical protein VG944_16845, partial [Fimbriimonas sp.]|nr:hypothetical protein [Fimbriimonas sp.]
MKIDVDYTLEQLTGRFQSVKDGLPELLKNATDHYERLGKDSPKLLLPESQQIVVAIASASKSLLVLDFGGASSSHFEKWKEWSSRTASSAADSLKIQGGHGNGGKAFMVRGSNEHSFLESVVNGKRTRIGFDSASEQKRFHPGDVLEGSTPIVDLAISNPSHQLDQILAGFKLSVSNLPASCAAVFNERQSYTAVVLQGVRDWSRARASSFPKIT